ncbi:sensor domain-containing diguanylate cyclase [Vreelandella zhuhanensis]|nr:GGDEF domain-containing protein [Halomonas zhuhanensis]
MNQSLMRDMEYLRLLETAMEQSFNAVLITTASLDFPGPEIVYVNAAMTSMSGYSREELLGATPRLLQGPKTDREMLHRLRAALAAGEYFEANTVNYRKDGIPYQVEWNISPVRNEAGVVTHFVSVQRDITRRMQHEQELKRIASTDMLTGLANRLSFDRHLEKEIERTRRYERPLSLIMLDIDHFKSINDVHGHDVGDQVLVHFARVLSENLRTTDFCARWAGDEFMVLAPETALSQAVQLAEKLRQAIVGTDFPEAGPVTASFGVVEVGPDELATEVVKRADLALYQAKAKGRNREMAN